jgi:hypothetical protein
MKKLPDDCMPRCENCNAGCFEKGEEQGECRLLPMDWVSDGDGGVVAAWKPAYREGWCRHFMRQVH